MISHIEILNECKTDDLILDVVAVDRDKHYAENSVSIVFIKNTKTNKTYSFGVNHYDFLYKTDIDQLVNFINSNIKGTIWAINKKKISHVLPVKMQDVELAEYFIHGKVEGISEENYLFLSDNVTVPFVKHLDRFERLCGTYLKIIKNFKREQSYLDINNIVLPTLSEIEKCGLYVNIEEFNKHFKHTNKNVVFSEYYIYTATGRPSNRFGGINYAALNTENLCRRSFISRFGNDGMLVSMDYSAYHPHIIANLTNYKIDLKTNIYTMLGEYYFSKKQLTEDDIKESKQITFKLLYGNIPEEFRTIPYFNSVYNYIKHRWDFFNTNGYVETPIYKRHITKKNLYDPNPNKLFNYILQASETEFSLQNISRVLDYLRNRLSRVILYTYDSILLDVHKNDGLDTLREVKRILIDNQFPVKCKVGLNYHDMADINI